MRMSMRYKSIVDTEINYKIQSQTIVLRQKIKGGQLVLIFVHKHFFNTTRMGESHDNDE
jgi:hypothetical protein